MNVDSACVYVGRRVTPSNGPKITADQANVMKYPCIDNLLQWVFIEFKHCRGSEVSIQTLIVQDLISMMVCYSFVNIHVYAFDFCS